MDLKDQPSTTYVLLLGDDAYAIDRWSMLGDHVMEFMRGSGSKEEKVLACPVLMSWKVVRRDTLETTTIEERFTKAQIDLENLVQKAGGMVDMLDMPKDSKKERFN